MNILGRDVRPRTLIAVAVVLAIIGASTTVILLAPPPQLSAYATKTSDTSDARLLLLERGYAGGAIAASPLVLDGFTNPENVLVIVLGVEIPYRESERDAIVAFVERGGKLLLADDFGYGNLLSNQFGVTFQNVPIRTEGRPAGTPLEIANASAEFESGSTYPIALNDGTALHVRADVAGAGRVVARASRVCYDNLRDDCTSASATFQEDAVVAYTLPYGKGRVVFVSDPHVFANAMLPVAENKRFLREIVDSLLPQEGVVVFDESRHGHGPATTLLSAGLGGLVFSAKDTLLRWLTGASVLVLVAFVILFIRREEPMRQHRPGLDSPTAPTHSAPAARLRTIARAKLVSVHNVRETNPTPEALAGLATDERIKALVASENGINTQGDSEAVKDLVQRIRSYGRRDSP